MMLEIAFARPLSQADRRTVLLTLAALARTERVRFARGGWTAQVYGEALGAERVRRLLSDEGLLVESVRSTLAEEVDRTADDDGAAGGAERVRPPGR